MNTKIIVIAAAVIVVGVTAVWLSTNQAPVVVSRTSTPQDAPDPNSSVSGSSKVAGVEVFAVGDEHVPVHPMGLFSEHTATAKPFPIPAPRESIEESIPAWWEQPNPLTEREIRYLRYLSSISFQLPKHRWDEVWSMGGNQTGLQTIRFYAAWVGYAASAIGMRTPAYTGLTRKITASALEHLFDKRSWKYVSLLWTKKPWYPDSGRPREHHVHRPRAPARCALRGDGR